nr:MAG TPA: hypothetical protein [Caudoviricetes sp.]
MVKTSRQTTTKIVTTVSAHIRYGTCGNSFFFPLNQTSISAKSTTNNRLKIFIKLFIIVLV